MDIECDLIVIRDSELCKTMGGFEVQVPPLDLLEHFSMLLLDEQEADMIFSVRGETFPAHKIILATRSPVFKAHSRTER
jgi:speckle-type POZ protein